MPLRVPLLRSCFGALQQWCSNHTRPFLSPPLSLPLSFHHHPATPPCPALQSAEGSAFSGYDYAKDATASAYDSALQAAYANWQVRGLGRAWAWGWAGREGQPL